MKILKSALLLWVRFSCSFVNTVLVLAMMLIVYMTCTGPPYAITRMKSVTPEMSRDEVIRILGKPQDDFGSQINYRRLLSPGYMSVHFDKDGKFAFWGYESH